MKSRVHAVAGILGLTLITLFFISSVTSELIGDEQLISQVKKMILFGVLILVPSMIVTGASGRVLAGKRSAPRIRVKKRRMAVIAVIGLTVLVPCAVVLQRLAAGGDFGSTFYMLQAVELIGGGINITLMGLNVRDGRVLAGRTVASLARSR